MALGIGLTGAVLAAALAAGDPPVTVRAGNLELTFDGDITPRSLPRDRLAPVGLSGSGEIGTIDLSHPPALREFVIEADRHASFDVSGLPRCRIGLLRAQDSRHARAACPAAIVGTGVGQVEVTFPEQAPIVATSPLTIFNGGSQDGVTTLYVHVYLSRPGPVAVVATVKIARIHAGRYGLRAVAAIPRIAGGSGSTTHFSFEIARSIHVRNRSFSVVRAMCADGRLQARGTALFEGGLRVTADLVRSCVPRG